MLNSQRYTSFSKSYNVGLASIKDAVGEDNYNTITNELKETTEALTNLANSVKQGVKAPLEKIQSTVDDGLRATRDTFSMLEDLTRFSPADLEKKISDMLPDIPGLSGMFRTLASQCRDGAAGSAPGFKPFNDNFGCNDGKGKCSSGAVNGLLSKATGGMFGQIASLFGKMLRSLWTLANLGYSAGLCKIFSALINGMPNNVVQRGAAGLLALHGGSGNSSAVMDIAANMRNTIPSLEVPSLVGRIGTAAVASAAFTGKKKAQFSEGMLGSFSAIEPNYNISKVDGITSTGSIGLNPSKDLSESAGLRLKSNSFSSLSTVNRSSGDAEMSTLSSGRVMASPFDFLA